MTDRDIRSPAPTSGSGSRSSSWDQAYRTGGAPWDVGHPQQVFVRLTDGGGIRSPVLDAGCGSGEHTLFLVDRGHEVVGVDISPVAIGAARRKAAERGIAAAFEVHDVRDLGSLGRTFETVIDSGTFHVFEDADAARYVDGLRAVVRPGGAVHLLCFSDAQPGQFGPRRINEAALRSAFADGWTIESLERAVFEVSPPIGPAHAWLARFRRLEGTLR